jgi:hypothetical protein
LELEDDVFAVQAILDAYVAENRETGDTNRTDRVIRLLLGIPGILSVGVGLFKLLDHIGLLPKAIIDASPFHTSMVISNLASIGTNHIYHHCYQFGTTSIILTVGVPKEIPRRHGKNITFERCLPLGVVMDERICSGSYFALAFSRFREYLADPTLLEGPSRHPVIREWAKPGEYERIKAKKDYKKAKKAAKALPRDEQEAAEATAKAAYTAACAHAAALAREAKEKKRAAKAAEDARP